MLQDNELISSFKNGDQSAYVGLYQKYIRYAFGTALPEKIKINNNDGLLISGDVIHYRLYWTDGEYCFRMFGQQDKDELVKIAESMK